MSTILEALKKSEQERKQKSVPTLTDKAPPQESSRWPWVVISLVLICLSIALLYLFTRLPDSGVTANLDSATSVAAGQSAAAASASTEELDAKVEVITWSPELERRFAMIDGKMMRVGDYLSAGVKIEDITEDSVVFNHRGVRKELKP